MKLISTFSLVIISLFTQAQTKKICMTVDDLPIVPYGVSSSETQFDILKKLLDTFEKYDVPAIGYVNEGKLYPDKRIDSAKYKLLEMWPANGFELGNHTFSHGSYHRLLFEDFTNDILKGEQLTRPLLKKYGLELKYFRHPFLHTGNTKASTDSLNQFLIDHNYIVAPVTIDNDDYLFAQAYGRAYQKGDSSLMKKIGESYIEHSEEKLKYYEKLTTTLFDRDMSQIMLTHANQLNADYMDKLLEMLKKYGYTFVSQSEALKDDAYNEPITKFSNWGISWLEKWVLSRGQNLDILKDSPDVPSYITN